MDRVIDRLAKKMLVVPSGPSFEALLPLLHDADAGVANAAAETIGRTAWLMQAARQLDVGKTLLSPRPVLEELDLRPDVRARLAEELLAVLDRGGSVPSALGWVGDARAAAPLGEYFLRTGDETAAKALGRIGPEAKPVLLDLLVRHDAWSGAVGSALDELTDDARTLLTRVLDIAEKKTLGPNVRANAVRLGFALVGRRWLGEGVWRHVGPGLKAEAHRRLLRAVDDAVCGAIASAMARDEHTASWLTAMLIPSLGPAAACTLPEIVREYRSAGPRWSWRPLGAISWLRHRDALPVLVEALGTNHWRVQLEAVDGLGRLGAAARSAAPLLNDVARTHWFPVVRDHAALALRRVLGAHVPAHRMGDVGAFLKKRLAEIERLRAAPCDDAFKTLDGISEVPRRPANLPAVAQHAPSLADAALFPVGDAWLAGHNRGEFGGELQYVGPAGRAQVVVEDNIDAIAETAAGLVAVAGLTHMGTNAGRVWRLAAAANGAWSAALLVELPSDPRWIGIDKQRQLIVDTDFGTFEVSATGGLHRRACQ